MGWFQRDYGHLHLPEFGAGKHNNYPSEILDTQDSEDLVQFLRLMVLLLTEFPQDNKSHHYSTGGLTSSATANAYAVGADGKGDTAGVIHRNIPSDVVFHLLMTIPVVMRLLG